MGNSQTNPFIVLEGTDGSGKTEQFKLLIKRLGEEGYPIATFDFPQYGKPSAFFVEQYLNGKYGGWEDVGPYKASVFYALDRFDVGLKITEALKAGKIVVSNRYVGSNMGHQGAKITDRKELMKFLKWVYRFEYEIMGIPRPAISIILHMPAEIAQGFVDKKGAREYVGGIKRDIHEADIKHLERAEQTYLKIAELFPKDFAVVECYENGRVLSIDEIHQKVYEIVEKILKRFKGGLSSETLEKEENNMPYVPSEKTYPSAGGKIENISYCECPFPEGVVSSPVDTVETCKYCGKIIKDKD